MPNLEHVTWREPTVTRSVLAISSREIPSATQSLIFWMLAGVNFLAGLLPVVAFSCTTSSLPSHSARIRSRSRRSLGLCPNTYYAKKVPRRFGLPPLAAYMTQLEYG